MKKTAIPVLIFCLCLIAEFPAAQAQSNYYNADTAQPATTDADTPAAAAEEEDTAAPEEEQFAPAQSTIVTSVQKCFDKLDPETAIDIKQHFVKPYEECQKRLAEKLQKAKETKAAAEKETAVPETPRNYVRVQPTPADNKNSSGSSRMP